MAFEVEEVYNIENGLPHYRILEAVIESHKNYERYPAKMILHPKYRDMGNASYIPFATNPVPAIAPLGLKDIDDAPIAKGYHVSIEYSEEVDEVTLKCMGFADLPD